MPHRLCISSDPAVLNLKDDSKWQSGQVHDEYPEFTGYAGSIFQQLTSVFVSPPSNISVVLESVTGSYGEDGSPTGCYGSIYRNESDFTLMPVEYPVQDYEKVDPFQIVFEGPLTSMYKVEERSSVIYADFLANSLKSFDRNIWSAVVLTFVVFAGLLVLRRRLKGIKDTTGYSAVFEAFSHMIGQDITDFNDRSGKIISIVMTVAFFLIIMQYYVGLMSTDLVIINKPEVINNYRDLMTKKNITDLLCRNLRCKRVQVC